MSDVLIVYCIGSVVTFFVLLTVRIYNARDELDIAAGLMCSLILGFVWPCLATASLAKLFFKKHP